MTITDIEKAAKLMRYEVSTPEPDTIAMSMPHAKGSAWVTKGVGGWVWFNPYTNKADLVDLECAFDSLLMNILPSRIEFWGAIGNEHAETVVYIDDHPDKFTARAHAVMAVVEQIYDRRDDAKA